MLQKIFQRTLDFILIFSLFLLSNVSAFFIVIWLVPDFVILEFVFWFMLTVIFIWKLKKDNLVSNFVDNLKRNWIILPFFVFSGLSIFWSVYWEVSLYRWLMLLFTIIAGGYIGLKYDLQKIIKLLSVFGAFVLLFGALFIVLAPNIGVMNYHSIQGAWRGIYWHKNHMGLIATFMNIVFLILDVYSLQSKGKQRYIFLWSSLYLISLLFVYKSDSVASYLTTIFLHGVVLLALFLMKFGKKFRRSHYIIFFVVLIISSVILYNNVDYIFGIFNRNSTLTGRIPMWGNLFDTYINTRPLGGYGFNAFWYLAPHRVALQQAAGYPDRIVIADNGFIDILVNTGYVGLILFLIFYIGVWWRSIRFASKAKDMIGIFPVILMSYTLLANISWSLIFENEGFFMLIIISVLFYISVNTPTGHQA